MSTLVRDTNGVLHQVAGKSVVDNVLSNTSKNPISNKAVTLALQNKVEIATRNLVNYYLKAETYTKEEVNALVGAISSMTIEVVNTLPTTDISPTTIYWVGPDSETGLYDQYIYSNDKWIKTGDTSLDLSGYVLKTTFEAAIADFFTKDEIAALFNDYYNKSDLNLLLDEKQNALTFDNIPISGSENPVKSGGVYSALGTKQDSLEYDTSPTKNSEKMVKSGGIYTALESKQDSLTFDNVPTENSANVVKSGGVYSAVDDVYKVMGENGAKNLIPYPHDGKTETKAGVTFTENADGSVTVNGTATAISRHLISATQFEVGKRYVLSGCPNGGGSDQYALYTQTINNYDYGEGVEFEWNASITGITIAVWEGVTVDNLTFYPMLRLASDTDSTYQPYAKTNQQLTEEDQTLANRVEGNWSGDGKNLLLNNATTRTINGVTFIVNDDGTVTVNGTATSNVFFSINRYDVGYATTEFSTGKSYRLSGCPSGGSSTTYEISGYLRTANDEYISGGTNNDYGDGVEFNVASDRTLRIQIFIANGQTVSNLTFKPMITTADTPNSDYAHFVPYAKTNQQLTQDVNGLEENLLQNGAVNVLPFSLTDIKANNTGSSWSGNVCTNNGVTYTFDEATQSITIDGTATGNRSTLQFYVGAATKLFKKGFRYRARTFNTYFDGTNDAYVQVYKSNSPYTRIDKFTGNSFVVPDDLMSETITVQIVVPQETTVSNQTIKLMIASDNFTGDYVPYAKSNKELTDDVEELSTNATKVVTLPASISIFDVLTDETTYPIKNTYWKRAQDITNGSDTLSTLLGVRNDAILRIDKYSKYYIGIEINDSSRGLLLTAWANNSISTLKFVKIDTSTSPYISQVTINKATT